MIITICLSLQLAAFQKTATHGGLKHAQVLVKGNLIMIIIIMIMIMIVLIIILSLIMMMIMTIMMMKIVLQDMSAWTSEPVLMSAMKKTLGPSVNARWGRPPKVLAKTIKRKFSNVNFAFWVFEHFICS